MKKKVTFYFKSGNILDVEYKLLELYKMDNIKEKNEVITGQGHSEEIKKIILRLFELANEYKNK